MKPDPAPWRSGWRHQLSDRVEDDPELDVILLFQFVQTSGQVLVRHDDLPEPHEGSHDFHVDLHGSLASQDATAWRRLAR